MYLVFNLSLLLWTSFSVVNARNINCQDMGELIFVNVLYRHGARNPEKTFKNDVNKHAFRGGLGELTNTGKNQTYELGKWLRCRYSSLLTDTYSPDLIYVMATDKDRVLMSAECCLTGMYPPVGDQVWDKELNWQPIPVHTIPRKLDKVLAAKASCPAYDKELEAVLNSTEVNRLRKPYLKIVDILNSNTGENRSDYKYIADIYDILKVQKEYNLELPEWSEDIFPHPMQEATVLKFTLATWTKKLARLKSGPLLQELIINMKNKLEKKSHRVMNMYVAHDTTIVNLFNTLGMFDRRLPPYAACVMLELRVASSGTYYISLFYRPYATDQPLLLTVPGCGAACPLNQFIALTSTLMPSDWDKECQQT